MIDTITFVNSLTSDNIPLMVTKFFDELMVLYNLVGCRHDLHIHAENSTSLATFTLLMETKDDALQLYNYLNGLLFSVYGTLYKVSMNLNNLSIKTIISKAEKSIP